MMPEYLYRYEDGRGIIKFRVFRETHQKWVIEKFPGSRHFENPEVRHVSKSGKNLFAFDTPEKAIKNFFWRSARRITYCSINAWSAFNQMHTAIEEAKKNAEVMKDPDIAYVVENYKPNEKFDPRSYIETDKWWELPMEEV